MPDVAKPANLTVAIATLDRPEGLAACLEALLCGQRLPAEVIVVDQGAEQSGRPVVASREGPVPLVYVHQERRGLSASRNAAIERAGQPVIAFTDDDCVPGPGWVAALEQALAAAPAPAAVSGRVLPLGPETPGTFSVSPRESTRRVDYRGKQIPWQVGTGGNFAVQREWLERAGLFDERLGAGSPGRACEDAELIYRLLRAGACIRYEPEAVIYHQRQSKAQRLSSRWNYGFGIGAFGGITLRKFDGYAGYILLSWKLSLLRELAGSLVRGKWMEAYQRVMSLSGTVSGLGYGLWVK